jgi:hypothetical protein
MDPKIILTTSRDPSSKLLQFAKVRGIIMVISSLFLVFDLLATVVGDALGISQFVQDQPGKLCGQGPCGGLPC